MYTGRVSMDGVGTVSPRLQQVSLVRVYFERMDSVRVTLPGDSVPPRSKRCPGCRHTKLIASRHAPRRNRPYLGSQIYHPSTRQSSLPAKPVKTHEIGKKVLLDAERHNVSARAADAGRQNTLG